MRPRRVAALGDQAKGQRLHYRFSDPQAPPAELTDPQAFQFECPLTVFKSDDAASGKQRRIAGIISTDQEDRQNERILQDGLTFDDFLANGWFNDNHKSGVTDILGYPETVKRFSPGDTLPDGQKAEANCTWVEGYLLDTPKANEIWQLGQALAKTHRRLGYSVEGEIVSRQGPQDRVIAEAKVRNVAITHCPVNANSYLEVLARSLSARTNMLKRSISMTDAQGSQGPVTANRTYSGQGAGQVLSRRSIGQRPRRKKRRARDEDILTRSEAVAYVKSLSPQLSEVLARALVTRLFQPLRRG